VVSSRRRAMVDLPEKVAQTQLHHQEGEGTNYSCRLIKARVCGGKANKEATPILFTHLVTCVQNS
jgi:hypothetical protein